MPTPPARVAGLALSALAALTGMVSLASCFDSDDKGLRAAPVGTTGDTTGSIDPGTSTGLPPRPPIDDGGNGTCKQSLGCLQNCIGSIQQQLLMELPELDLSCFLECDEELSIEQAVLLIDLFDCAFAHCQSTADEEGNIFCPEEGAGSTGSGSGSGSGSGTTAEPPPPEDPGLFDPCTQCLFLTVNADDEPDCAELRNMCQ